MSKGKAIVEWLKELPDGYRELALRNYDPDYNDIYIINGLWGAIALAFSWRSSPENFEFWDAVYNWAKGKGELPPLPEKEEMT